MDVRIGTSGWSYDHWTGVLYPPGLPVAARLDRYAAVFDTVELAYVVTDGLGLACITKATTDFVYVRMHGPDTDPPYAGSYSPAALRGWADRVTQWTAQSRRVLVYFNNDGCGNAVRNALSLREILSE